MGSIMKIVQLVTLGVFAVMCSTVQSQSHGGTLARPPPPPQASQLVQQSGAMRLIPGGGRTWVYDSRCNDWREVHSSRDCPMAYRFGTYESLCNYYDLADDSADTVYQAYTYNAGGYRFCRWTHACVACPIINQSCSFFRGRRSESDDEDSDSENRRRRETRDEDAVPEEWE